MTMIIKIEVEGEIETYYKSDEIYEVVKLSPSWTHQTLKDSVDNVFHIGTKCRLISGLPIGPEGNTTICDIPGFHYSNNFYTVCREGVDAEWFGIEKDCLKKCDSIWNLNLNLSEILMFEIKPSELKIDDGYRIDAKFWQKTIDELTQFNIEYVDVIYGLEARKLNDENNEETIIFKISKKADTSLEQICNFVGAITKFRPDENDIIVRENDYVVMRLWWD